MPNPYYYSENVESAAQSANERQLPETSRPVSPVPEYTGSGVHDDITDGQTRYLWDSDSDASDSEENNRRYKNSAQRDTLEYAKAIVLANALAGGERLHPWSDEFDGMDRLHRAMKKA